jgi:formylglycine-generating enzyme required for sulfatase activity
MDKSRGIAKSLTNASQTAKTGKNYLLAIGINDYDHCPKLANAVKDVEDFAQLMTTSYGFQPDHIKVLRDKEASYRRILAAFKNLVSTVEPQDSVIIYFSGHGELDDILDEGYWIPVEAKPQHYNQYIPNSTIQKVLNKINSFHTFLIVDSCYSGSLFLEGKTRFVSDAYDFPSRWGLTSGRATIVSDGKAGENSPFAKALLNTLSQTDSPLNAGAVCDFVKQTVAATSDKKQLPIGDPLSIKGHSGGQFVFRPVLVKPALPEDVQAYQEANTVEEILAFMRNFPDSNLRQAAVIKLEQALINPVPPPPPPPVLPAMPIEVAISSAFETAPTSPILVETPPPPAPEPPPMPAPAKVTTVNPLLTIGEPIMVFVPGGTFQMGSADGQPREQPVHAVTLSDFYIGKFPVTQKEWLTVVGTNPSHFKGGENRPVENVSWDDTQVFIEKLNALTGKNYRLPTEAEWEYAARGGNQSKSYRYAGSDDLGKVAWYDKNAGFKSHSVGKKQANELGIHDMSGNVWEWCQDWYADYTDEAKTNPKGPETGMAHVNRGGSWDFAASHCRTTYRCYDALESRMNALGFRLALDAPAL